MKVGVDLGGSHIAIGVINKDYKIIEKTEKRLQKEEKKNIKSNIEQSITTVVKEWQKKYKIEEIGMSVPGTVQNGKIIKSVNLGLKEPYDIKKEIEKELKIPVKIRNDAKCAAIAENKLGCLKGKKRAIFLTLGTGIGGAVLIGGKLLDTGEYPGVEVGHMVIEKNGKKCNCGNRGCFETYASMKAFKTSLRNALGLTEKTRGEELLGIIRSNKEGEKNYEIIEKIVEEFIESLATGIANLINIFEPEGIGIGGSYVYFSDVLTERLKAKLQTSPYLFNKRTTIELYPAVLANDAGILGSVL